MRHPLTILVTFAVLLAAEAALAEAEPPLDELADLAVRSGDEPLDPGVQADPAHADAFDLAALLHALGVAPRAATPDNGTTAPAAPSEQGPTATTEPEAAPEAAPEAEPQPEPRQPTALDVEAHPLLLHVVDTLSTTELPDIPTPDIPAALPSQAPDLLPSLQGDAPASAPAAETAAPAAPVHAAPMATALAASLLGAAGIQSAAIALRPLLELLRRWLFLPLYARVTKDQLLDHEVRQRIVQHVEHAPGACIADIQAAVGVSAGCVRHHLRALESNRLVSSIPNGRRRCYFLSRTPPAQRRAAATLASAAARRVYHAIETRPGISQQELAAVLSVSPTSILFHARRLEENGVVRSGRLGRQVAYWPAAATATAVEA